MGQGPKSPPEMRYSVVTGVFKQDEASTDPTTFDFTKENFGLIERSYPSDTTSDKTQWQRFESYLDHLNKNLTPGEEYKLLFLGRHGEGYHNVAEAFYGTKAWDEKWSLLPGNGTSNWTDAHLTPLGIQQAQNLSKFWSEQLATAKMPAPQAYYASPLARCLQTAYHTFNGLSLPPNRPFAPTIKELLREVIGEHTCDMRSSRTWISEHYPDWKIEDGFAETDELWSKDHRETEAELIARMHQLLQDLLQNERSSVISLTGHSGMIRGLLKALGHREFPLATGAAIPVLIRVQRNVGR